MGRLLLVEDEPWQGKLCAQELIEDGHEVTWVQSGEDAMETVRKETFDLIILDIYLPGMDGLESMGRILSQDRKIPVILYTSYSTYKDNFLSWAADAYLVKSADLTELKSEINRFLGVSPGQPPVSQPGPHLT